MSTTKDTERTRWLGGIDYSASVYKDDGCRIHPSCLSCPLPACIFDVTLDDQKRKARLKIIRQLYLAGLNTNKIVGVTGLKLEVVKTLLACRDNVEKEYVENVYLQGIAWP